MSIRIDLDNPPEFYTNLDTIQGRVILGIHRHENVGAVIVKLEGESRTSLAVPAERAGGALPNQSAMRPSGDVVSENHKILYQVAQVFPSPREAASLQAPFVLAPGQHEFRFRFKIPFNNVCGDPRFLASLGGGGFGPGGGADLFGLGGIRVMDGTRQLLYPHVRKTLPPSFTGFPRQAEIRYYVKVTVQRPGLFKENWRHHIGFKFLPIEPPRPPVSGQEAFARRPFTFHPRSPAALGAPHDRKPSSSFLGGGRRSGSHAGPSYGAAPPPPPPPPSSATSPIPPSPGARDEKSSQQPGAPPLPPPSPSAPTPQTPAAAAAATAPSVEMCARLPHPPILTCNKPVPLRLLSKKLAAAPETVYLVSLQIDLVGLTVVRCEDLVNTETTRWVVVTRHGLSVPVSRPDDAVGTETVLPDALWRDVPLPNTVMPSFVACNLRREYQLEIKLGLSWGGRDPSSAAAAASSSSSSFFRAKSSSRPNPADIAQTLFLPLHFSSVEVYSGLAPPPSLVEAMRRQQRAEQKNPASPFQPPASSSSFSSSPSSSFRPATGGPPPTPLRPPRVPPRPSPQQQAELLQDDAARLYPPQQGAARPGQAPPPMYHDDAPPSYDEAMAEMMTGPVVPDGSSRPAYSGVTNENAPSTIPEKR